MTLDLFAADAPELDDEQLDPGALVLRGIESARNDSGNAGQRAPDSGSAGS